jgi:hypothetical protein
MWRRQTPCTPAELIHFLSNPSPRREPVHIACGPHLCRLEILAESEWDALAPEDRPPLAEQVDGLGWLVARSVGLMN